MDIVDDWKKPQPKMVPIPEEALDCMESKLKWYDSTEIVHGGEEGDDDSFEKKEIWLLNVFEIVPPSFDDEMPGILKMLIGSRMNPKASRWVVLGAYRIVVDNGKDDKGQKNEPTIQTTVRHCYMHWDLMDAMEEAREVMERYNKTVEAKLKEDA